MRKKIFTLMITILLLLSWTACAGVPQQQAPGEPVKLIWWVYSSGDIPNDMAEVLERANEISAEKIGVTVDMVFKTDDQFSLDLNTGEYYDMTFTCSWCNDFDGNARLGYFYDLTDLVNEVTPGLYSSVDPWWQIGTLNDRIYGVPMLKDLGAEVFFRLNSDYFEGEKGLDLPDQMDFADLEPLLAMYQEDHPDEYALHMGQNGLSGMFQEHERIVDSYLVIPYSKAGTDEGTTIIPIWEDEEYMNMLRCLHRWYEAGYINPDAATTTELPYSLHNPVRSGTAWTGYRGWSDPDTVGFNVELVRYIGPNMSRTTEQGSLIAVNAAASEEHAAACLRYMELLYTDTDFRDLLAYGIEGQHFDYYEGTVIRTEEGANDYLLDNFVTGPAVSASVVSASSDVLADPDQWTQVYEEYENATQSDTHGFSYNGESTEAIRAALNAIWDGYYCELVTGTADPDETMAEIQELMYEAGLQEVLDDAQNQLDEYLNSIE
ncbi:MAG: ABC transporter substrate-binding protein [Clostridiales bacterium]|nr:ABC transporter substrate-binding protein [Clostridiales bacterium]